ncbi:MAG: hypothetical protein Q4C72_00250 [Eubacteriales bacterium]|nr:hypothetical protein [Eubacteriales bacterium]
MKMAALPPFSVLCALRREVPAPQRAFDRKSKAERSADSIFKKCTCFARAFLQTEEPAENRNFQWALLQ